MKTHKHTSLYYRRTKWLRKPFNRHGYKPAWWESLLWLVAMLLALVAILSGCSSLKPSWQGLYIGQEIAKPFESAPWSGSPDTEATAIIGIGRAGSVQFGVWGNLQDHGYRIAIEKRIW